MPDSYSSYKGGEKTTPDRGKGKILFLCSVILLIALANYTVQAGSSPTILVEPTSISPDENVIITVTAVVPNTIIADENPIKIQRAIIVDNPAKGLFGRVLEDYYLELNPIGQVPWGPIILPDVGDGLRFRFPDAMVEVIDVGDQNVKIQAGTRGWWTAAEDPRYPRRFPPRDRLATGAYVVVISGHEGEVYFHEFNFFAVGWELWFR